MAQRPRATTGSIQTTATKISVLLSSTSSFLSQVQLWLKMSGENEKSCAQYVCWKLRRCSSVQTNNNNTCQWMPDGYKGLGGELHPQAVLLLKYYAHG